MAVDWHIHVVEPHIDAALKCFFHNHAGHELADFDYQCPNAPPVGACPHSNEIANVATVEVGSKHWQNPGWTGHAADELLDPITAVINAFENFKPITPELAQTVRQCYDLPSASQFPMEDIGRYRDQVIGFVNDHMGGRIFAIGW